MVFCPSCYKSAIRDDVDSWTQRWDHPFDVCFRPQCVPTCLSRMSPMLDTYLGGRWSYSSPYVLKLVNCTVFHKWDRRAGSGRAEESDRECDSNLIENSIQMHYTANCTTEQFTSFHKYVMYSTTAGKRWPGSIRWLRKGNSLIYIHTLHILKCISHACLRVETYIMLYKNWDLGGVDLHGMFIFNYLVNFVCPCLAC